MGLLSSTYVTNNYTTTEVVSSEELTDNTEAIRELSIATKKLSKSIDRGRIKISHDRYSNLMNRSNLLKTIQSFMHDYLSVTYAITQSDDFKQSRKVIENRRCLTMNMSYNGPVRINDVLRLDWSDTNKTCNIYIKDELFVVKQPVDYIPQTDGEVDINDSVYKSLLYDERVLPNHITAIEELPELAHKLLDRNWKQGKDILDWISYCERGDNKDSWINRMSCEFGPIETTNYKWSLNTEVGSNSFRLYLEI